MGTPSRADQPINAVEMVRRIRDAHYERFKDRPVEERIAYFRERAQAFEEATRRIAEARSEGAAGRPPAKAVQGS